MKKRDWKFAPEKRIIISLIGWLIEIIIEAVRKRKELVPKDPK